MEAHYGAGGSKRQNELKSKGRVLLRAIATTSAACGIILNIIAFVTISDIWHWGGPKKLLGWAFLPVSRSFPITAQPLTYDVQLVISLVWDLMHLAIKDFLKGYQYLQAGGDTLAFLGFLIVLVTNGIMATGVGLSAYVHIDKILLLAYNSFPWIICA